MVGSGEGERIARGRDVWLLHRDGVFGGSVGRVGANGKLAGALGSLLCLEGDQTTGGETSLPLATAVVAADENENARRLARLMVCAEAPPAVFVPVDERAQPGFVESFLDGDMVAEQPPA